MGIKNLNTLIEKITINGKQKKHLSNFAGKMFAIDTNVYLYKYLYGKSNHIDGMFFMINKFKKFNIIPVFVFDGKPPDEKLGTIKNRRLIKDRLEERMTLLQIEIDKCNDDIDIQNLKSEVEKIEKKIIYVNKVVIEKTKKLFDLMGVMYINADCEAEHYCSKLCNMELVDGVVSEDMDTIACGSKLVIRNFTNRDDYVEVYYYNEILYDLDLSPKQFIDLCILLGNDYNHRPRGCTPEEVYNLLKENGSIEKIIENDSIINWTCNYKKIRSIIKLEDITINMSNFIAQQNKKPNITLLKLFLKDSSTIDEKTYLHRIKLIYYNTSKMQEMYRLSGVYKSPYGLQLQKKYQQFSNQEHCIVEY